MRTPGAKDKAPRQINPKALANIGPRKPGTGLKQGSAKAFYVRASQNVIDWIDGKTAEERGRILDNAMQKDGTTTEQHATLPREI